MDAKVVAVLALVLAALCLSDGKPVSLSYRCPCRFFESHVARANVKHLKILNTPNCALQIVARLKNNNRQVCIDPKLKWIQEYLEKALNNPQPGAETPARRLRRGWEECGPVLQRKEVLL
ncbi:stromal cell-derived factor 1 isoform X1 [Suricata suricatta]|uniref:Stromal cell-derived factor 1 n=1 Tax=Suricata suricatta TaxID=37032 RepID=A0A673TAX2_SURSU|nr:stromal cell-derived factor 1 isoform X1 [Suricata suricatta]